MMDSSEKICKVIDNLTNFLLNKNKKYGDSALNPIGIFAEKVKENNSIGVNGILIRMDDKLSRIKNSKELRKNDIVDLTGYLILLCCAMRFDDFKDLID